MEKNSWADQWDSSNQASGKTTDDGKSSGGASGKYKEKVEAGLGKTKAVASSGLKKVKIGTSLGLNWVKDKYNKTTTKKNWYSSPFVTLLLLWIRVIFLWLMVWIVWFCEDWSIFENLIYLHKIIYSIGVVVGLIMNY